ncbi:hypothetical protein GCM10010210_54700 [Pseudonocardia hydrocarbonoxydans]
MLVAVLAALVVAGGVVTALVLGNTGGTQGQAAAPVVPTSEPAPTTEAAPTTTAAPTTAPTTTAAPTTAPAAQAVDAVSFVQNYYALLPGNTDAAWVQLSPQAQAASGGRSGFDNFYGGLQSVTLSNARQVGEGTVEADVLFVGDDGSRDPARYRFVVSDEGGSPVIQSFTRF